MTADSWFASDQEDIDLGAAMRAASSTPGGWNVSGTLGAVQGITNNVSGLIRSLYQTRTDINRAQVSSAIDMQRAQNQLTIENLRARQLAGAPGISFGGLNLQPYMPLIVIGAGALLWKRLAK